MTKHFEPGQMVTINTYMPDVPSGAQGKYIVLLRSPEGFPLPYPHEVLFKDEHLLLHDGEVSA